MDDGDGDDIDNDDTDDDDTDDDIDHKNDSYTAAGAAPGASVPCSGFWLLASGLASSFWLLASGPVRSGSVWFGFRSGPVQSDFKHSVWSVESVS